MEKQEIEFRDPVVKRVVNKFVERSNVGFKKYGRTLDRRSSNLFAWLNHFKKNLWMLYCIHAKTQRVQHGRDARSLVKKY
jgi:hypothetical protein